MRNFFTKPLASLTQRAPAAPQDDAAHNLLFSRLSNGLSDSPLAQMPAALAAMTEPNAEVEAEIAAEMELDDAFEGDANPHSKNRFRNKFKPKPKSNGQADDGGTHIIVVLGVPAKADGRPSEGMRARIEQGYREALRDPKAKILVTGSAVGNSHVEAEVMARGLLDKGIDKKRIIIEPQALITLSNASRGWLLLQKALPKAPPISRMVVVAEPFHAARSLRIFSALLKLVSPQTKLRGSMSERVLALPSPRNRFISIKAQTSLQSLISKEEMAELSRNIEEKWKIAHGW
jgi:hypothetical protein